MEKKQVGKLPTDLLEQIDEIADRQIPPLTRVQLLESVLRKWATGWLRRQDRLRPP